MNAPIDCLDGDENSSVQQPDENCDFKLKIHEGLSTNKSSYRLISVSHTKKVYKNLNYLEGEGYNYACNICDYLCKTLNVSMKILADFSKFEIS